MIMKKTRIFLVLAAALVSFQSAPALAKAPYYFVDSLNNKQRVFTNPSCNGEVDQCRGFGTYCGKKLYARPYSIEQAKDQYRYTGIVTIRRNGGSNKIVCNIKK